MVAAIAPPSPPPLDPSEQRWADRIDRLQRLGNAINNAVQQEITFLLHAAAMIGRLALIVALVLGALWLAARLAGPHLQQGLRRRRRLTCLQILPPIESSYQPEAWIACFRTLFAIAAPRWKSWLVGQPWLTFEYLAAAGRVRARCWFPEDLARSVRQALQAALPGLELITDAAEMEHPPGTLARARLKLWREPLYPLGSPRLDALASAVAALSASPGGVLQLAIAPDISWERRAARRLRQLSGEAGDPIQVRLLIKLLLLPLSHLLFYAAEPVSAQPRRPQPASRSSEPMPPLDKAFVACWRTEVRICCWADHPAAARQALRPVAGAFQAVDGANRLRARRVWWRRGFDAALRQRLGPRAGNLVLSSHELAQLCHLPLAGVAMDAAHVRLAPQRPLASEGTLLGYLEDPARTPVRIPQPDRRQHLWLLGPTGSGKSTLMLNLARQDIEAGVGVGVIDPKGDLVRDLLERIPAGQAGRVVLFDPAQRERPFGLNALECEDEGERELVVDGVVSIFHKTYERFWGPRTDDILRAALLTLLRQPGATLCEVPILLLNREVRSRLTRRLDDPIGLRPFWQEYEALSEGQRAQMVGPVLNKLRSVLLRPTVRNLLGQSRSTLDLAEIMDRGGILLVNLSKGALGEESSRLLGAFIVARLWQTVLRRAERPERWRPDFNLYLDEFQNYLHLPQSLDDVLAEARAYRFNLTLANQQLGQLQMSTRQAVEANARSKVVFQLSQEDARHLAYELAPLTAAQLEALELHQAAVRLCQGGHSEAAFTAMTEPAPPSLGEQHGAQLARQSLERHSRPRPLVEAEIRRRLAELGYRGGFTEIA